MRRLAEANPKAVVLVFRQYADSTDGAELREVIVPERPWTRETGDDRKSTYEIFYPDELQPSRGARVFASPVRPSFCSVRSLATIGTGHDGRRCMYIGVEAVDSARGCAKTGSVVT